MTESNPKSFKLLAAFILALLTLNSTVAHAQLHKCINDGAVTYQSAPCQPIEPRKQPTVEQLNAERKKQNAQAKEAPAVSSAASSDISSRRSINIDSGKSGALNIPKPEQSSSPTSQPKQNFSCDNRKYCSQMTSCAEATYFLAHCPGVKMDGGHKNGIPCEQQWCNK